ncbi:MAG TPA: IS110 family transposase [Mycobacteriales bacterium]|nr:IS110 family transposase [Mycobacteriales bacterium]
MPILTWERDPIHIALDVHKDSITAGVLQPRAVSPVLQRIGPDEAAVRRLLGRLGGPSRLRVCYEAGPTGFELARALRSRGIGCEVIAPSLIPKASGEKVKTDRRDAAELVMLFRAGLLTAVHIPPPRMEAVRDLARARIDVKDDLQRAQRRLLSFCLRHGHVYRGGSHWTGKHEQWLAAQHFEESAAQRTFEHYLALVRVRQGELAAICADLRGWLDDDTVGQPAYRLAAYHAIGYLGAVSIVAEVGGQWDRFGAARAFMAFTGLVPAEHSSGSRQHRSGITKTGNAVLRTQLIESAWHYRTRPVAGATLAERRSHVGPATVALSVAAHRRLSGRYRRLSARRLNPNVVTTAVARELAGFVWAEMTATD